MTDDEHLLHEALEEQKQQLRELDVKLNSWPQTQDEREKVHAMVSRIRYNLKLPPLGASLPELLNHEKHRTPVDPTDSPVLRRTLAVLERKLEALNKQLNDLQEAKVKRDDIRALVTLMSASIPANEEPEPIEIEVGDSLNLTVEAVSPSPLWVTVRQIVSRSPTPLNLTTITETLRGLGYHKVTADTVRSAIFRKPDVFARSGDGYVVIDLSAADFSPEDRG